VLWVNPATFSIYCGRSMDRAELQERTRRFAHRSVKLALALPEGPLGEHIKRQLIRCSTSVASDYRAACLAQSRAGFVAKLSIVVEEIDESCFWLEFVIYEKLLGSKRVGPLLKEAGELTCIFISARKTTRDGKSE